MQPPGAYQVFGEYLRRYRELSGLSQEALAERAGLSPRGLLYLERGVRRPYPATLRRLADALALTAEQRETLALATQNKEVSRSLDPETTEGGGVNPPEVQAESPPDRPQHNLPASLSSFIGREHAQAQVRDLIAAYRMVTLVGVGGVGKTRLALAVAAEIVATFPDGVWLVELAALADPLLVAGTVTLALGLREEPGRAALDMLRAHCASKRMLLVLDNCEHLLAACTALAGTLLRAAPDLHILATSREPLAIAGERRYRVPSLSVPDPGHLPAPELASSYEAVRLFVQRVQEHRLAFALTPINARPIAEICAHLDGLPLAIELAAARMGSMSVEAIASHLDDRFRLLTTRSGDLPTRQRTLRATLDWSWDLLDMPERTLLGRFSVFAGGWALEAATAVCTSEGMDEWAVIDGLGELVNCSLVQFDETADGVGRYRLLETVREHARERLMAAGEETTIRDRQLTYFMQLAEQAIQAFWGAALGTWMDRLEMEHDNLRAALAWARTQARADDGLTLAAALAPFWEIRGHIREGRHWLEGLLADSQGSPGVRARALNAAGSLTLRAGDFRDALVLYQQSLALRRELGDLRGIAVALINIGNAYVELGEYTQAEPAYAEALPLCQELKDFTNIATIFNNQSVVARELGQYDRAEALLAEALTLRREQGDLRSVAESLNSLGWVASARGQYARAMELFTEGLQLSREVGGRQLTIEALEGLAWTVAARGQSRRAARIGGAVAAERMRLGISESFTDRRNHEWAIQIMRDELGEEAVAASWAEGREITLAEATALALEAGPTVYADEE